ncbi:MAG: iron-containing alcohol dehydrogenase [Gemmobacter sp.]
MTEFSIAGPGRIDFGRGVSAAAPGKIRALGARGLVVHGASPVRAGPMLAGLRDAGCAVETLACPSEPTLAMLLEGIVAAREARAEWIVGIGGGSALDLAKAIAALAPARGRPEDHLEVVGPARPLEDEPLPFVAVPTVAGSGAEATPNAVIALPDAGRKVSLRDLRMLPRIAVVDPALTDGAPPEVTLGAGLDAVVQLAEAWVSTGATRFSDALVRPGLDAALRSRRVLSHTEDPAARDDLAWASLSGGLALANAGLGAVHGLAGVLGARSGAAHGPLCATLFGPVLAANRSAAPLGSSAADRLVAVCAILAEHLDCSEAEAPEAFAAWCRAAGVPALGQIGVDPAIHSEIAEAALASRSMRSNPVRLSIADLVGVLDRAS